MTHSPLDAEANRLASPAHTHRVKPFAETALRLLEHGYSPLPQQGQACLVPGWPRYSRETMALAHVARFAGSATPYDIGQALGFNGVVAVDRDTDDEAVCAALRPVFEVIYGRGGVPIAKFGSKGLTSFFRCTAAVFVNRIFRRSAQEILVELLGPGRSTTLPPSIHPKAGRPYAWATTRTLLDTTPDELPVLLPEDVLAIETALSPWIEPPKPIRAPVRAISSTDLDEAQRRRQESYGLKILDEECRALAGMAKDSGRNRKVYDVACRVGRWVHHGLIQECHVVDAIVSACVANGLFAEDGRLSVIKSAHSGLSKSVNDQLPLLSSSCRGGTRHA